MKFHEITTSEFSDPDFTPSIAALGWRRPSVFTIPYLAKKFGCRATALQSPEVIRNSSSCTGRIQYPRTLGLGLVNGFIPEYLVICNKVGQNTWF